MTHITILCDTEQGVWCDSAEEGEGRLVPGGGAQGRQQRAAPQGGER